MTKPYEQPPDTILREIELDYYSTSPYNIILQNISDNTVSIMGDCGHLGRYGINIAQEMPLKKVYLCELRSETEHLIHAKRFCENEDLSNIFFTVADTRIYPTIQYSPLEKGAGGCKGYRKRNNPLTPFIKGELGTTNHNGGVHSDRAMQSVTLPFKDETFDFAYTFELENFVDYHGVFKELMRVLKPGGKLLVGVPNYYNFLHTVRKKLIGSKDAQYEKSFKHRELKALFQENGFCDVKITGAVPMQSLMRLSKVSKHKKILNSIKWWSLMKIIDMTLIRLIDLLTKGYFSYMFGFEIIGVGKKIVVSDQWSVTSNH